jgi:hypothetical protein
MAMQNGEQNILPSQQFMGNKQEAGEDHVGLLFFCHHDDVLYCNYIMCYFYYFNL